jgi:O-succinylbenzoate synthase
MQRKFQNNLAMSGNRIIGINLYHVKIPMKEPFRISSGEVAVKDGILIELKVKSEDKILSAFGEASPMAGSFYSNETPESVWEELITHWASIKDFNFDDFLDEMEKLNEKMINAGLSSYARAGFETALWDAYSKIKNIPIFEILGAERTEIESGLAVGIYDKIDDLIRVVGNELDTGNYKRVKIKVQKEWDITPIKVIRKSFGDIPLMVDANCAYTRDDIEHLRKFDEFELLMIEQPLKKDDLEGHAILQEKIHTPICLDESVDSIDKLKLTMKFKSCKIINIKIQRVGGILISKKFHDICKGEGIPVWIGTMPELGIGSAYALNLCMLDNCKFPTDVESSRRWYLDDIITPLIDVKNGIINFTDDLSFEVNFDKIEKYTIKQKKINF